MSGSTKATTGMGSISDAPRRIYFETSSWNKLAKHPARDQLVGSLKDSETLVLASVLSVGEVLQTPTLSTRRALCETIRDLHGGGPLLERPVDIMYASASAFRRGDSEMTVPECGPAHQLWQFITGAAELSEQDTARIMAWLKNSEANLAQFIEEIKPPLPDRKTNYCSREVLDGDDFLSLLLKYPNISSMGLSVSDIRTLCDRTDVWRAAAATLGYMIELSTTHAPKGRRGRRRPGAADLWQAVYLGTVEIFVSSDTWLIDGLARISSCMEHPRCVVDSDAFLEGIPHWSARGPLRCWLCGCQTGGMHVPYA